MPGGRPTLYKPEYCDTVVELAKRGFLICEIAEELDVHESSLNEWGKKHEEFSFALARVHQINKKRLLRAANDSALGEMPNANHHMLKFLLSANHGMRESNNIEHSGSIEHKILIPEFGSGTTEEG